MSIENGAGFEKPATNETSETRQEVIDTAEALAANAQALQSEIDGLGSEVVDKALANSIMEKGKKIEALKRALTVGLPTLALASVEAPMLTKINMDLPEDARALAVMIGTTIGGAVATVLFVREYFQHQKNQRAAGTN